MLILIPRDRFADCGGKGSGTGHGVGQGMQAVYLLHVRVVPFLLAMVSNSRGEYSLLSPSTHIHREWVSGLEGEHAHLLISITLLNFLHITYHHLKKSYLLIIYLQVYYLPQ